MPTVQPTAASGLATRAWRALVAAPLLAMALQGSPARAQDAPADESPTGEVAAEEAGFAVQPSGPDGPGSRDWFTYTLDPGAVFGDTVAVSNLSSKPVRFVIYPTDAVSVADTAGFAALKDTETPTGVGTWITLAAGEYTVPAGQRIDVPFSITVPQDAEPGDHAGAILAVDPTEGNVDPASAPDGLSFNVRHRMGARVYVRVSGPVTPALRIDELSVERHDGTATVKWEVANTGNVRLTPTAQVRVTGLFGRTIHTAPLQDVPELLPGANYVGASIVYGLPRWEPLTAHLVVNADGVRTERSTQLAPYPWALIAMVALLFAGAGGWYRRRHRRRRGARPGGLPSRSRERVPVPA